MSWGTVIVAGSILSLKLYRSFGFSALFMVQVAMFFHQEAPYQIDMGTTWNQFQFQLESLAFKDRGRKTFVGEDPEARNLGVRVCEPQCPFCFIVGKPLFSRFTSSKYLFMRYFI